jgi:glutamate-1-semialdehyde 2,1-aminomutase
MAAAVASLELLRDGSSLAAMRSSGDQIVTGIIEQAATHGHAVRLTGPSTMPYLAFEDDLGFGLAKHWAALVAEGGVYLNPSHNWFMSTALRPSDIAQVLEATDRAFRHLDPKRPV